MVELEHFEQPVTLDDVQVAVAAELRRAGQIYLLHPAGLLLPHQLVASNCKSSHTLSSTTTKYYNYYSFNVRYFRAYAGQTFSP